jgi:hypothetical protein
VIGSGRIPDPNHANKSVKPLRHPRNKSAGDVRVDLLVPSDGVQATTAIALISMSASGVVILHTSTIVEAGAGALK